MSVFTDVAAEGILLAGGGRAILLQIADSAVGAGVARHSDFANRPLDRLTNTVTYAYATVFATDAERAAIVEKVNRAHRPVVSAGDATTPAYSAFDPASQLWVAATLYESALGVYERVFGPLCPELAESVYQQYSVLGTALQVRRSSWPTDLAAFRRYWNDAVSALVVSDDARRVAHDLLHPRVAPIWLRAVMPVVRLFTIGLLPAELRVAFRLPWNRWAERRFALVFGAVALVYRALPRNVRSLPMRHYLSRMRSGMVKTN
ncbi:oxygenase MpaB family protein [Subtercola frigoramans]|uniref:Uncharacterized protein (DUF2236 family) n=1 Tax=Subtercola frigoramans TaxID=120298 RepID=A0ABS2L3E6_9MICO|nr:oxygenase MpaB family protein [Subtercola frigoramans]MBM7471411.1 uncharacterized protein (DUF2236 family) [Subtercola frigoramans]